MTTFPWQLFGAPPQQRELTARELMLKRISEGVPPELATRAAGVRLKDIKEDPEVDKALAEGEILLFERARDSGVTGIVRAAMRHEAKTWQPKAETPGGMTLEDYLKD